MTIAQTTALQWSPACAVAIRPDLSLSRLLARAAATCRTNQTLAQLCQILGTWLGPRVPVVEVRGHQLHPWNELADSLARYALGRSATCHVDELAAIHALASAPRDLGWLWMQTTHPAISSCFPPLLINSSCSLRPRPQSNILKPFPNNTARQTVSHLQCLGKSPSRLPMFWLQIPGLIRPQVPAELDLARHALIPNGTSPKCMS